MLLLDYEGSAYGLSGLAALALAMGRAPAAFAAATASGARMRIPDALRYGLAVTAEQTTADPSQPPAPQP